MAQISVVLADDDELIRSAIVRRIDRTAGFELAGTAATASAAIERCASLRPRIAVVDVHMPGGGPAACAGILATSPATRVITFSAATDEGTRRMMAAAGSSDYVVKGAGTAGLLEAIRRREEPLPAGGELADAVSNDSCPLRVVRVMRVGRGHRRDPARSRVGATAV